MKQYTKLFSILTLAVTVLASTSHASSFAAPVQVANTDASPVPVRDVTHPTRKPFHVSLFVEDTNTLYKVPADKRLVIEQISGQAYIPGGDAGSCHLTIGTTISPADSYNGQLEPGADFFALTNPDETLFILSNQSVKLYASAGTSVVIVFHSTNSPAAASLWVTLTGYLEDAN